MPFSPSITFSSCTDGKSVVIIFILEQKPSKAFSFKLPDKAMKEIGDIAENYIQYHSAENFSALEIYKVLG